MQLSIERKTSRIIECSLNNYNVLLIYGSRSQQYI